MYNKCAKYTPWAIKNVTLLVFITMTNVDHLII